MRFRRLASFLACHSGIARRARPGTHEHRPLENGFRARRCAAPRNDGENLMTEIGPWLRRALIGLPFLWLGVFFLLPLAIVAAIRFAESADTIPPFAPLVTAGPAGLKSHATLANYCTLA